MTPQCNAGEVTEQRDEDQHETLSGRLARAARSNDVPLATIIATVLVVGIALLAVALLWVLRTIVLYVLVASFIAVLLAPAVAALERRGIRRTIASSLVFAAGLLGFAGLAFLFGVPLVNAVSHFSTQAPSLVRQAEHGTGAVGRLVSRFHLQHWVQKNAPKLSTYAASISKPALSIGAAAVSTIVSLLTMGVLSFYVLLELPKIWRAILGLLPDEVAQRANRVATDASGAVSGYVLGNFVTSVVAGLVVFITLELLGVPFAPLLALWVALIDLLPLIGGLLAGVPTVLVALLHSPTAGIVTLIVFLVYQQVENHVLNPLVMSRTVRMSPALVLLAVLAGAVLGGRLHSGFGTLVGALIGIPVGSALQVIVRELRHPQADDAPPTSAASPR